MNKKFLQLLIGGAALVLALSGCGGGGGGNGGGNDNGGDGGGTAQLPITTDNAVKVSNEAFDTYDYLQYDLWFFIAYLRAYLLPSEGNSSNAAIASKSLKKTPAHIKRSLASVTPASTVRALAEVPTCFNEGGAVTLNLSDTNGDGYLSQGESATYEFQNCEFVSRGIILSGKVTLQAVTLSDTNKEVLYTFSDFKVEAEDSSTTLNGDLNLVGNYQPLYYEDIMKGGSLTGKETDGATTTLSNYVATYIFYRDDENSTSEAFDADKMDSTALGGSVGVKTSEPFKTIGEDDYASSGSMTITGANSSTVKVTAESDGVHVNLAVDANGDGAVDQNFRMTWSALEDNCPIGTDNPPPVISGNIQSSTNYSYNDLGQVISATTTITISASDPDNNSLTYSWSASNGSISGNTATATWQRVISFGQVVGGVVTATVSDGQCGGISAINIHF